MFCHLLRADGYNPVTIEGYRWRAPETVRIEEFCGSADESARSEFGRLLNRPFQPGELLAWASRHRVAIGNRHAWLRRVLASCERELVAHGHDGGYWTDHWTYVTDLLEAFADIYPDQIETMLTSAADIGWYDDGAYVVPRADKYVMRSSRLRQLNAVLDAPIGRVALPPVTVLGKLCAILAVKAVSFDYACQGIEMEAGRPGWNDALNGLPGLFGSSTAEAAEVARLAQWIRDGLAKVPKTAFPVEVADFLDEVQEDLNAKAYCWDRASTVRERYRRRLRYGVSGQTRVVSSGQLTSLLTGIEARARDAVTRSVDRATGLVHTYYRNDAVLDTKMVADRGQENGFPTEAIERFDPTPLPLFLEGQVHWLRLQDDVSDARRIFKAVRSSPLFDEALQMYKTNECLDDCPPDIGRARTFTRGWFENESIWLHMSYKYLLELLRAGLCEEFFDDAKTMLVPFMDPEVYGRSILENSSFLASSANPDAQTHGRGFMARLSGATAEFISIWLLLTMGRRPFFVRDGELGFRVQPVLPGTWFTEEPRTVVFNGRSYDLPSGCFACAMLGTMLLVYHNESRRATFGPTAVTPVKYVLDESTTIDGAILGPDLAKAMRQRAYHRVDVWLD